MGDIHLVVPRAGRHLFADGDDLDELRRSKQFVVAHVFGHGIDMLVEVVEDFDPEEDGIDLIARKNGFQFGLEGNAVKQVFGCDELMPFVKCQLECHFVGFG